MRVLDLIKEHEGFRANKYICPAGHWTIGYGFNLDAGMTQQEAQVLLEARVHELKYKLLVTFSLFWVRLSDVRKSALVDMAYQMGLDGLKKFEKMIAALEQNDYERAAAEILNSKYARQTPERAQRIAAMMRTDQW